MAPLPKLSRWNLANTTTASAGSGGYYCRRHNAATKHLVLSGVRVPSDSVPSRHWVLRACSIFCLHEKRSPRKENSREHRKSCLLHGMLRGLPRLFPDSLRQVLEVPLLEVLSISDQASPGN